MPFWENDMFFTLSDEEAADEKEEQQWIDDFKSLTEGKDRNYNRWLLDKEEKDTQRALLRYYKDKLFWIFHAVKTASPHLKNALEEKDREEFDFNIQLYHEALREELNDCFDESSNNLSASPASMASKDKDKLPSVMLAAKALEELNNAAGNINTDLPTYNKACLHFARRSFDSSFSPETFLFAKRLFNQAVTAGIVVALVLAASIPIVGPVFILCVFAVFCLHCKMLAMNLATYKKDKTASNIIVSAKNIFKKKEELSAPKDQDTQSQLPKDHDPTTLKKTSK